MTHPHPAAPAWTGNLQALSEEILFQRDRELSRLISSILVRYSPGEAGSPFRRATPTEQDADQLNHWVDALINVRNEEDRRRRLSLDTNHAPPPGKESDEMSINSIDINTLTPLQIDGQACIVCGATCGPMIPVGIHDSIQLFSCESHQRTETH